MQKGFVRILLAIGLAIGLIGCGGGNDLTAPDGSVYLEIIDQKIYRHYTTADGWGFTYPHEIRFGDGGVAFPQDALEVTAKFQGRGRVEVKQPVTASVYFVFENGDRYENNALKSGPFTGYEFKVNFRFQLQDGLVQVARQHPDQLILYVLKFSNGQEFQIFGFYIQER